MEELCSRKITLEKNRNRYKMNYPTLIEYDAVALEMSSKLPMRILPSGSKFKTLRLLKVSCGTRKITVIEPQPGTKRLRFFGLYKPVTKT